MTYGPVNGEMTELKYDCRNRLIKAGDTTYEYNAENTRTAKEEKGTRTEYIYGNGLLYENTSDAWSGIKNKASQLGSTVKQQAVALHNNNGGYLNLGGNENGNLSYFTLPKYILTKRVILQMVFI